MSATEQVELAVRRTFSRIMEQPQMDVARAFQILAEELARLHAENERPMKELAALRAALGEIRYCAEAPHEGDDAHWLRLIHNIAVRADGQPDT